MGQKRLFSQWKKRWFHTEENILYYSLDKSKEDPIGVINLKSSLKIEKIGPDAPIFEITLPHRRFRLQTDSPESCELWVQALKKIKAYYKFQTDSKIIVEQGFLLKRGGKRRNWKKRLFVLKSQ